MLIVFFELPVSDDFSFFSKFIFDVDIYINYRNKFYLLFIILFY